MNNQINVLHQELANHPLFLKLNSIDNLKTFMRYHAFAVWDFMSLLKALQRDIAPTIVPWRQSIYNPKLVRLINEIVLGEESDINFDGTTSSHFSLYIAAMEEIGADTSLIKNFILEQDKRLVPSAIADMLSFHLELAENGKIHEIASSFFYGREKLIPDMFSTIVSTLEKEKLECPSLIYYLKRHIEVDGDEHGPMANECLELLLDNEHKKREALQVAQDSLVYRNKLWNFILSEL